MAEGLAHDLNNVLAPIVTAMEVLQLSTRDEGSRQMLELIGRQARHGTELIQQITTLAEGIELVHSGIQPQSIMRDLKKFLAEKTPKNITLEFEASKDLWMIFGSLTQIYQALLDVCLFAIEAMPEGGRLGVRAENVLSDDDWPSAAVDGQQPRYIQFTISDTGPGIPEEMRESIFEPDPGGRAGPPASRLFATDMVIKAHHGRVSIAGEAETGTAVKVYLPAAPGAAPELLKEKALLPRGHGEWILIVEDEEVMLRVAQQTFEIFDYSVLTAGNGADAIAAYMQHRDKIALVFTDISMPIMDGLATIRTLRKMDPKLKIIATSGQSAKSQLIRAVHAGATHFLPKPYEAQEVLELVRKALQAA